MSELKNANAAPVSVNINFHLDGYENPDGSYTLNLYASLNGDSTLLKRVIFSGSPDLISLYPVPPGVFPNEEKRREWQAKTENGFWRKLFETITFEASAHLADVANFYLDEMGLDPAPVSRKELVEMHLNQTRARVSGYLHAKGNRSKWTRQELERAIRGALTALPKAQRTYTGVVKKLKETHAKKAPPSVPALKQLVIRHKIDWMKLKSNANEGVEVLWQG